MSGPDQAMRRRALEQVRAAGCKGLIVERGLESATQRCLVEDGLIWQKVYGRKHWQLTLSPQGELVLENRGAQTNDVRPAGARRCT